MQDAVDWAERYGTGEELQLGAGDCSPSSEAEVRPEAAREGSVRGSVQRVDGQDASEARSVSAQISSEGAGSAPEERARTAGLNAGSNSQLPDGQTAPGAAQSELLPCPFCGVIPILFDADYRIDHADDCYLRMISVGWIVGAASNRIRQWNKRAGNASVLAIASLDRPAASAGTVGGVVGP